MKFRIVLTLILFFCGTASAHITSVYNINTVTSGDGLAQNMVDDIVRGSRGFVWIATWNGLSRFDGNEFRNYTNRSEPTAIRSNFVRSVAEDKWNRMWIATDGGVDILDMNTGEIVGFDLSLFRNRDVFDEPAENVFVDSHNTVWITSSKHLVYILFDGQGNITAIERLFNDVVLNAGITALCEIRGALWVGVNNTIHRLVRSADGYKVMDGPSSLVLDNLLAVHVLFNDNGRLWIGTDHGLFRYDLATGATRRYMHDPSDPASITQNYITDIVRDSDDRIFISTYGGVNIYRPYSDDFERLVQGSDLREGLNCNFVNCMMVDDDGIVWLGTEKGGINKLVRKRVLFTNMPWAIGGDGGLPPPPRKFYI